VVDLESAGEGYTYYLFETKGRGPETFIKNQQKDYIKYFENLDPVLDMGCGRGEFLELLKESGIASEGFDSNEDMVEICIQKGLKASRKNVLTDLDSMDDAIWGGIFAGQVVEHFHSSKLINWYENAYRLLKPGGVIVIETVNTSSIYALINHYYRDPTHHTPRHPETYAFMAESAGFLDVKIDYVSPVPDSAIIEIEPIPDTLPDESRPLLVSILKSIEQLQNMIYAPCDILITATKPLAEDK